MTACPVRTGGGAPTKKPHPTSAPVGAPAPGANGCLPGSHRGGAPTTQPHSTPAPVGAPAPGANDCPPGSHRGGAPCISPRVLVSYQHFGRTKACGAPEGNDPAT